jgi:hypothetical protein
VNSINGMRQTKTTQAGPSRDRQELAVSPKSFNIAAGLLVAVIAVLLLAPWESSGDPSASDRATAASLGYYPPAPSNAVGMTPAWREFADNVDRICAGSFNYALGVEAQARRTARVRGWSEARAESAVVSAWADEDDRIVVATAELGQPPRRADLFARWRANVAHRTSLWRQMSEAAGAGRFDVEGQIHDEITQQKKRADELGQRFGLRICTSN